MPVLRPPNDLHIVEIEVGGGELLSEIVWAKILKANIAEADVVWASWFWLGNVLSKAASRARHMKEAIDDFARTFVERNVSESEVAEKEMHPIPQQIASGLPTKQNSFGELVQFHGGNESVATWFRPAGPEDKGKLAKWSLKRGVDLDELPRKFCIRHDTGPARSVLRAGAVWRLGFAPNNGLCQRRGFDDHRRRMAPIEARCGRQEWSNVA